MIDATREQLRLAGVHRIEVARDLCQSVVTKPALAAYLAHVGLECLLKAWLLTKVKVRDTHQFRRSSNIPTNNKIFSGTQGHNLDRLAKETSLERFLRAEKIPHLLASRGWSGLISEGRPYDVRYGAVSVSSDDAKAEVDIAHQISTALQRAIQ